MWKNYLKIAIRNFRKQQLFSLLNVFGLAVGLAAGMFIFLYVQDERSYDQFHEQGSRIYRITETFKNGDAFTTTAMTPYKVAPLLAGYSSAVEAETRLDADAGSVETQILHYKEKKFETSAITFVDSNFFDFFSFTLLQGHPKTVLLAPNTLVISESAAQKIFPGEDPIGKLIKIQDGYEDRSYEAQVTGIMADMPHNSHFHFDYLVSKKTGDIMMPNRIEHWGWTSQYSYILLKEGHQIAEVEKALKEVKEKNAPDWFKGFCDFGLQAMEGIHLRSNVKDEIEANGNISNVYIFSIVGLFILLIACINYMNLATARASKRAREVGMRKVIGAHYFQLVRQFLTESVLVAFLSLILACVFVLLLLPAFNQLTAKALDFRDVFTPEHILIWAGLVTGLGILAGSFPAFFLSSFKPMVVLKGLFSKSGSQTLVLRKGLVVLQFTISIALMVGMLVIFEQWNFLRNKRLGIETEQMLLLPIRSQKMLDNYTTFKKELLQNPKVQGVTATSKTPLTVFSNYGIFDVKSADDNFTVPGVGIDEDFVKVYGTKVVDGRNFSSFEADSNSIMVNEAAVRLTALKEPIGQQVDFDGHYKPFIVGVLADFNFESLHNEIQPMFFYPTTGDFNTITVKIAPEEVQTTLDQIKKSWDEMGLSENFSFTFLDQDINKRYEAEIRFLQVFTVLSILAILIACLGLFGLAAFSAEQRTKEIGIRKVLGATISGITTLLAQDFLKLILIALVIACPLAWYFMNQWLQDFAYHIDMQWWMFVVAGVLALGIAFLTIGFQSIKAALMNPVKSLRSE